MPHATCHVPHAHFDEWIHLPRQAYCALKGRCCRCTAVPPPTAAPPATSAAADESASTEPSTGPSTVEYGTPLEVALDHAVQLAEAFECIPLETDGGGDDGELAARCGSGGELAATDWAECHPALPCKRPRGDGGREATLTVGGREWRCQQERQQEPFRSLRERERELLLWRRRANGPFSQMRRHAAPSHVRGGRAVGSHNATRQSRGKLHRAAVAAAGGSGRAGGGGSASSACGGRAGSEDAAAEDGREGVDQGAGEGARGGGAPSQHAHNQSPHQHHSPHRVPHHHGGSSYGNSGTRGSSRGAVIARLAATTVASPAQGVSSP